MDGRTSDERSLIGALPNMLPNPTPFTFFACTTHNRMQTALELFSAQRNSLINVVSNVHKAKK